MKRSKGGWVAQNQKEWLAELDKCDEVSTFVCYGANEAIDLINNLCQSKQKNNTPKTSKINSSIQKKKDVN